MAWFIIIWTTLMILVYYYIGRRLIKPAKLTRRLGEIAFAKLAEHSELQGTEVEANSLIVVRTVFVHSVYRTLMVHDESSGIPAIYTHK